MRTVFPVIKIFILLLFPLCLFSQRVYVDEVLPATNINGSSLENTQRFLELSEAYLTVNTDSALFFANAALASAKKLNNKKLEAGSYVAIGQSYDYVNQQTIALEYFLQARTLYEDIREDSGLAVTFYAIGEMYNTLKDSKTAVMNFHKSLRLFTAMHNELQMANLYGSLGNVFFKARKYDSAKHYNNLGLAIGRKENDTTVLQDILGNIADVLIDQGKMQEAEPFLTEANMYAEAQGNYYGIAYGKNQLAKIAIARKKPAVAIQLANEMETIGLQLEMDDLLMDAAELKYKAYRQMQSPDSALLYMERYKTLSDTLNGRNKYAALDSLLNTYRFGKKQKEVELLQKTNQSNTILLVSSCFALLITGVLLVLIYKRSKERSKMNAALQQQTEKLQNVNQLKDKMFSIIGHDLRGPISSLKGLVDFMKNNSLSNEDSEMVVKELRQSVNSVDMLLENLLVWAKMQMEGNIVSKPEHLQIASLVDETMQLYQKPSALKSIALNAIVEEGLAVLADRNYLSLILRNLVNNAIKFTSANGKVMIEAKHFNNQIKLCVEDNGIGMSKEEVDKLFNLDKPFSKRGTMDERGSGLGLLFVKEYTERCGGSFSITSEKGQGSRFCITLNKPI